MMRSEVVIVGNGPSKDMYTGAVDYACNLAGVVLKPRYLCSSDPWLQYDIIRQEYKGICLFVDFDPLPIELPPEGFIEGQIPSDYDYVIHNPEQRENAVSWHFYSTGDTMNEYWNKHMSVKKDYWRTKRAYVCFVPKDIIIHNIERIESQKHERLAPSGAYAIHHAIQHGAKKIHTYGFDSMAGVMFTESTYDAKSHNEAQADHFTGWYKQLVEENPEVEILWHTRG